MKHNDEFSFRRSHTGKVLFADMKVTYRDLDWVEQGVKNLARQLDDML